jgi:OPA family sugar phosphate sensor protein UhpC-like MFS transporter
MVIGLLFTSIFTIFISLSNSYTYLVLFCCITGWFQGFGWPAVTKQLTHWYNKRERGFWWGLCSTSHTIGGALSAIICGYLAKYFGWRFSIYAPTIVCLLLCFILLERLRGTPKSLNLPSATEFYKKYKKSNKIHVTVAKKRSVNMYITQIIKNKFIWLLSIVYLLTYAVKTAVNDWTILYLVNQKEYTLIEACTALFWFEIGGLLGICVTGTLVGSMCKKKKITYLLATYAALIGSLLLLYKLPHIKMHATIILLTLIGFLIFSPQMLIGLIATESTDIKVACAANGFVSGWAYVGAAVTGYPLGLLISYSWDNLLIFLLTCSLLTLYPILILLKRLTT